jgi:hypothetical protein
MYGSGFAAGLLLSVVTAPVGVSGAVFLLPVQLDVLGVPNPRVTPTNLLFNVIAVPGALVRYQRQGQLAGPMPMSVHVDQRELLGLRRGVEPQQERGPVTGRRQPAVKGYVFAGCV